MQRVAVQGV